MFPILKLYKDTMPSHDLCPRGGGAKIKAETEFSMLHRGAILSLKPFYTPTFTTQKVLWSLYESHDSILALV